MDSHTSQELTDQQSEIVLHPFQTISIFAAPGSGKTTVLTEHIVFQLEQGLLRPTEIMAVTFTKQAAQEMAFRIKNKWAGLGRRRIEALRIGTFHAQMFAMLLSQNPDIPILLDPAEQYQMMRTALQLQSLPHDLRHVHESLMMASRARAQLIGELHLRKRHRRVLEQYEKLKSRSHRWDFDDILVHSCNLFENESASGISLPVRYILVDEFQDTNDIQWEILSRLVRMLGAKLFVVGDDDQSIYGFRGANPGWLVDFSSWYPESASFELTLNFRSDRRIIESATSLIEHNRNRRFKDIAGRSLDKGVVRALRWRSEQEEADAVARGILTNRTQGTIAVLARTRKQLERTWSVISKRCQSVVEFRTFHDAKGKEWDTVHIVGAIERNPYLSQNGDSVEDIEEERRLFYVAVTRARHRLYIHSSQRVQGQRTKHSRFVDECGL